jgi:hypothetical protein
MKGSKRGALRPFRAHQGRRNTLRHSRQLKHVTVRVFEINASAAIPVIELAVVEAPGGRSHMKVQPSRIARRYRRTRRHSRGGRSGDCQTRCPRRTGASMSRLREPEARARIQRALEGGGAQFLSENGGGPGVRLRKSHQRGKSR